MISVAMATYNGEQYVIQQLDSIRKQTCKVDEIVIVDDCSNDNTVALLKEYKDKYKDCCIRLFENETNLGYKKNFKKALSLVEGDIIFLCDQDDIWMEDKVKVLSELLQTNPEIGVVSSAFVQVDGEENIGTTKRVYKRKIADNEQVSVPLEDLIFHNISQGCAMALRKEVKDLYLDFFEDELPHDWMINIIAAMQKKCCFLNIPLFYYRIHDYNTIGLNDNLSLNKKKTLEIRTKVASQSIQVINFIEKVDAEFYGENLWLEKIKKFSIKHVECLENRNFLGLVSQNFSAYYRKLKTFRGRMLDLVFCLNK